MARCGRCGLPILDGRAARRPIFTTAKATLFLVEEVHLLAVLESGGKPLPERLAGLLSLPYDQLTSRQLTKIRDLGMELEGLLGEAARTDPQVLDAYRAARAGDEPPAVVALFDDFFDRASDGLVRRLVRGVGHASPAPGGSPAADLTDRRASRETGTWAPGG